MGVMEIGWAKAEQSSNKFETNLLEKRFMFLIHS